MKLFLVVETDERDHVLEIDHFDFKLIPNIGDYVNRTGSGWFGRVTERKIMIDALGGMEITCRLDRRGPHGER